jgi:hypothetical protein
MDTERQRKEAIVRRQETSFFWALIHVLGSLELAILLLATIALACAVATVTESNFSTRVAQYYIYKAPWFNLWLTVLCVNLFAVALTRWPWQRKHLGFIVTHAGIILLLIGAMVGKEFGFEGSVTLNKGEPAKNRVTIPRTIFQVESPKDAAIYTHPLPVDVRPPSPEKAQVYPLPDTPLRLRVERYSEHLVQGTQLAPSRDGLPGLALRLSSGSLKRETMANLVLGSPETARFDFFGLALVEWVEGLSVPKPQKKAPDFFRETQMILAASPETPVVHNAGGAASGYRVLLEPDETEGRWKVTVVSPAGMQGSWPLPESLKKTRSLSGDPVEVVVEEFWPDFAMKEGKPVSLSAEARNPAVLVNLKGPRPESGAAANRPVFQLAPAGPDRVRYHMLRNGVVYGKGELAAGETMATGWADWQATIVKVLPQAALRPQVAESPDGEGTPGIFVRLIDRKKQEGEAQWIVSGTAQALEMNGEIIRIGFGQGVQVLPFWIRLDDFEVPRDEGTDTPSDFISTVTFEQPSTGRKLTATAHMNYPASFPGGFWRSCLGQNYKFSQASWNPENLNETTLQVLYDPGWPLKWFGSLMICLGIGIMFYFKPYSRKKPPAAGAPPEKIEKDETPVVV